MSRLIKNCKVLQMFSAPNYSSGKTAPPIYSLEWLDIRIEKGMIEEIKPRGTIKVGPNDETIIDGEISKSKYSQGKFSHVVLPGFVDNHIHSRAVVQTVHHDWSDRTLVPKGEEQCKEVLQKAYHEVVQSGTTRVMDYPEYPFNKDANCDSFNLPLDCMKDVGLAGVIRILCCHDKRDDTKFWVQNNDYLLVCDRKRIEQAMSKYTGFSFAIWIPEEDKLLDYWNRHSEKGFNKLVEYLNMLYKVSRIIRIFILLCIVPKAREDC